MSQDQVSCPKWAVEKITQLRELEVKLGNIVDDDDAYQVHKMNELVNEAEQPTEDAGLENEQDVEAEFKNIVIKLTSEKFEPDTIVTWINQLMCPKGGLPYCDIGEVQAVLK